MSNVLALDPSSTRTGWCLMDYQERLLQAGLLIPPAKAADARARIESQCLDLLTLLAELRPAAIVLEWPSGHAHRRRHRGGGAGLAVYGAAVGALWREARAWARQRPGSIAVHAVLESEWTAGQAKGARTAAIAALFPAYEAKNDPGGDIADAIGLALWCQRRAKISRVFANP